MAPRSSQFADNQPMELQDKIMLNSCEEMEMLFYLLEAPEEILIAAITTRVEGSNSCRTHLSHLRQQRNCHRYQCDRTDRPCRHRCSHQRTNLQNRNRDALLLARRVNFVPHLRNLNPR